MKSKAGIVSVTVLLSSCLVYISFLNLRKDGPMDMRVPFKRTPEGMKNTNKTGSKILGFVELFKHKEDSVCGSLKKKI